MCILTAVDAHRVGNRWVQQLERLTSFMKSMRGKESELQDVRELILQIKAFQEKNPIPADDQALEIDAREELAELGFRVEYTTTEKLGVKFENREKQIDLLVSDEEHHNHGMSSFWLIDAPARYGKTFFIFEVKRQLLKNGWKVCYFSFKDYLDASQNPKAFLTSFRRTFDKSFPEPWSDPTVEQLRNRLVADLGNQASPLAIFIDDAELVTEKSMVVWLKNFLADVRRAHMPTGRRFIGLVSGRYISPNWYDINQVAPFPFDKIPMGSLGFHSIMKMIEKVSSKFEISKAGENMEAKETTARIVQMIGAGCPECTINLLIDIGRDTAFNPTRTFFDQERRLELFNQHVAPVCDLVLEDIQDPLTRKYFPYLCILRRYNRPLLRELMSFLQTRLLNESEGETAPEQMLETLNRSGLIMIDINRAFQGDDNFRQLFGLQKWLFDNQAAQQINDWAMRYFQKQITQNKGSNGIGYNREAFIEYLYHYALKLRSSTPTKEKALRSFAATLAEAYRRLEAFSPRRGVDPYEWGSHKTGLLKALMEDVEIRAQMAHVGVSETEYAQLCNLP